MVVIKVRVDKSIVSAVGFFSAVNNDLLSANLPQVDGNMPIIVDLDQGGYKKDGEDS